MFGRLLDSRRNSISITTLTFRLSNQYRVGTLCFFVFFVITGCSSLHVDVSPSVDWSQVRVLQFQSPPEDLWNLNRTIKSELADMGFQVEETHPNPDLLFSYFTQESPDLSVESQVLTRLKSLHVQFIDPSTKILVTTVDYFYPEVSSSPAPDTGVKEVFSGLRQQIHKETNSQSAVPAREQSQTVPAEPVVVDPPTQIQESQAAQQKSNSASATILLEENTINNDQSELGKVVASPQEAAITVLKKPDNKSHQAVQKTRSPWLPKFKSWGFENWGGNSTDDY